MDVMSQLFSEVFCENQITAESCLVKEVDIYVICEREKIVLVKKILLKK